MPLHVFSTSDARPGRSGRSAISRRRFLALGASGAAVLAGARAAGALGLLEPAEKRPVSWALLADTHIHASDAEENAGFNMARNFRAVLEEVLALEPGGIVIDGDVARLEGNPGDYASVLRHTEPVRARGVPIHMTLGNHDHREHFLSAFAARGEERTSAVASKYASRIQAGGHHWLFLDSLHEVNKVPGTLGEAQLRWLATVLDAHAHVPAFLFVHHNPEPTPSGLQDVAALLAAIRPRRQVKAVFFGHTHTYRRWQDEGIWMVNLPAVGYSFSPQEPVGWVRATAREGGLEIELRSLDPAHPEHGKAHFLAWRAGTPRRMRV